MAHHEHYAIWTHVRMHCGHLQSLLLADREVLGQQLFSHGNTMHVVNVLMDMCACLPV